MNPENRKIEMPAILRYWTKVCGYFYEIKQITARNFIPSSLINCITNHPINLL